MAETLTLNDVRDRLSDPARIGSDAFDILRTLCAQVGRADTESRVQELVLRALEHRDAFGSSATILDGLVRQLGLFPYLEREGLGLADTIAYEFHRPLHMEGENIVFHRVQAEVYRHLMDGDNVILSAPTSFGKSLIIDAVLASGKYVNVAVIVPTIALIDETRRRLSSRFASRFKIITHASQRRGERNLLIMTQERILELDELLPLDFFVIDEFYKLLPRHEDTERSLLLNQAFYELFKTGAQFYLLGPNIRELAELPSRIRYRFIKTDYKTVASEVHHVKADGDDMAALVRLCKELNEPTLIYCSSPARVRAIVTSLLEHSVGEVQSQLTDAVEWVGSEYHPEWMFAKALHQGIGMHHGKLPRTLAQFVVRSFNEELVKILVCTSTLIEGVNTKATNVIIFDNKIARRKFDYFTYNNILGRSGRMFQHFVGRVYIFHEPPAEQLPIVDIPIFTQPDDAPESLLVQIDDSDLAPAARSKMSDLSGQDLLDLATLRQGRGIDPRAQITLAREIRENANYYWPRLFWSPFPTKEQLYEVCRLIWDFLVPDARMRAGVVSGKQLAFRIDYFRSRRSAVALIKSELGRRSDDPPDDVVEEVIDFLRSWASFAFPRYLLAVDRIQHAVFTKLRRRAGSYSMFAGQVENWFLDPTIMALDEYGVPVQIGQKLEQWLRPEGDLDTVLARLKELDVEQLPLSSFEKSLVVDAKEYI